MYKSYFKIAWRTLVTNKGYSAINILGLAAGMAVGLLIGLWVIDELTFNTHFKNYDRIAQVTKGGSFEGKYYQGQKYLQYPLIEELKANYSQNFKHIVPASNPNGAELILATQEKKLTRRGVFIGEAAPEMFSFEMVAGDWKGLEKVHSVMISESTALALFGRTDALGKVLKMSDTDVEVTGVFKDFPANTDLKDFQFFAPWTLHLTLNPWVKDQDWMNHFLAVYVEIAPGTTTEQVGAIIKKAEMRAIEKLDYMKDHLKYDFDILLHPMPRWHLYSNYKEGELQNGPLQFVWFIGSIGFFVVVLACINFMNLSTARSEKRAKEVGIRKTVGSARGQLMKQFFVEAFVVVIVSYIIAMLVVYATLPSFNQLAAKKIALPLAEPLFWMACLFFIFLAALLAGSYPALYLSSMKPVRVLKGAVAASRAGSLPRKALVVLQFTISVMLIACTAAIYHQLMFVKNRPVGYTREGLIMISKRSSDAFEQKRDIIRAELKNTGAVAEMAESGGSLMSMWSGNGGFNWEGKDPLFDASFATLNVSPNIGKTLGWEFVSGRDFSEDIASDSAALILNEAAVEYMKLNRDPQGMTVHWTNKAWGANQDFHVVGVIKNMIMNSPFEPVRPAIYMTYGTERVLLLRLSPEMSAEQALSKIEPVFTSIIPDVPFDYRFVDREFATKFSTEDRIGNLASVITILAILISCLGLLGLASFVTERRTKEVGIRKILGATSAGLWRMLSQEFVTLVLLSCVIAIPAAYYILSRGLERYDYKTGLPWWIFVAAAGGAALVAFITVSYHAIKSATANPVKNLRTE